MSKLKIFNLNKRQKIAISSLLLGLIFIGATLTSNILFRRLYLILIFGGFAYLLSLWSLKEGLNKTKLLVVLILPTIFCMGLAGFYFVLNPNYIRWATRIPFAIICSLVLYLMLLSLNIFNVASQRTIPLYRAASTASLLFTIVTAILVFSVIYTFRLNFYLNGLLIFLTSFILSLHVLWTVEMDKLTSQIIIYSLILGLLKGEVAIALSFWPIIPLLWSVFLALFLYILLGTVHQYLIERLTKRTVLEYFGMGALALVILISFTSWTG